MAEPRSTAQEAGDPSTSPERLIELTEKHPQLHRLLVLNPSTPEVARQWILATNTWAQRAYAEQQDNAASTSERDPAQDSGEPDPQAETRRHPAISATAPAWAELPEEPVWGDLSPNEDAGSTADGERTAEHDTVTAAADETPSVTPAPAPPLPAPLEDGTNTAASPGTGVRIASPDGVVPLGPAPTSAAPRPAESRSQTTPVPLPDLSAGVAGAAGAGAAGPSEPPGDEDTSHRRIWLACGGCLLLALVLLLASVFAGRALFAGDDDPTGQPPASETATDEPTQEPTEEEATPEDPVSPAPDDAQEMTELSSPTGNITCLLEEDSVACTIVDRDFSEAGLEDCEDGPFSIEVADGEAAPACGSSFLSDAATTLEYDRSATYGDMACTSRFDGMTCWNTMTGKGFSVNRGEYGTF